MSDAVFPSLPGLKWGIVKTPVWSTKVLTAASGRETRGSFQSYPRWRFTLGYEFLRGGNGYDELQELAGFFNQRGGSLENFLFRDPSDYTVTDQALGLGDGTAVDWRLVRSLGGFVEPVLAPQDVWLYLDRGAAGKWRVAAESRVLRYGRTDDLTAGYWSTLGVTSAADVANNPDGAATADRMTEDTSVGSHRFSKTTTPVNGSLLCFSWRVKPESRTACCISSAGLAGGSRVDFDLTGAGTATVMSGAPVAYGIKALPGGWYRCWQVIRSTSASSGTVAFYMMQAAGGSVTYTGDGTSSLLHGGVQYETLPEGAPLEPTEYRANATGGALTIPPDFTLGELGYLTLASPPAAGNALSWSGTFWYRVRFTHDTTDFEQFLQDLYSAKKVEFISEK